jgi:hypothetical protein
MPGIGKPLGIYCTEPVITTWFPIGAGASNDGDDGVDGRLNIEYLLGGVAIKLFF